MDPVVPIVVASSLAVLWIVAALQKLRAFKPFVATVADYRLVPKALTVACAVITVVLESLIGVGLLVPASRAAALFASAALLALYGAAVGVNLLRGRSHIDCGCMGPAAAQSLSIWLVGRNLLLALAALACLRPSVVREFFWLDAVSVAAAVAALILIYAATNHLITHAPDLARLRR